MKSHANESNTRHRATSDALGLEVTEKNVLDLVPPRCLEQTKKRPIASAVANLPQGDINMESAEVNSSAPALVNVKTVPGNPHDAFDSLMEEFAIPSVEGQSSPKGQEPQHERTGSFLDPIDRGISRSPIIPGNDKMNTCSSVVQPAAISPPEPVTRSPELPSAHSEPKSSRRDALGVSRPAPALLEEETSSEDIPSSPPVPLPRKRYLSKVHEAAAAKRQGLSRGLVRHNDLSKFNLPGDEDMPDAASGDLVPARNTPKDKVAEPASVPAETKGKKNERLLKACALGDEISFSSKESDQNSKSSNLVNCLTGPPDQMTKRKLHAEAPEQPQEISSDGDDLVASQISMEIERAASFNTSFSQESGIQKPADDQQAEEQEDAVKPQKGAKKRGRKPKKKKSVAATQTLAPNDPDVSDCIIVSATSTKALEEQAADASTDSDALPRPKRRKSSRVLASAERPTEPPKRGRPARLTSRREAAPRTTISTKQQVPDKPTESRNAVDAAATFSDVLSEAMNAPLHPNNDLPGSKEPTAQLHGDALMDRGGADEELVNDMERVLERAKKGVRPEDRQSFMKISMALMEIGMGQWK